MANGNAIVVKKGWKFWAFLVGAGLAVIGGGYGLYQLYLMWKERQSS